MAEGEVLKTVKIRWVRPLGQEFTSCEPRGSGHKPQGTSDETDACTVYSDRQTLTWRSLSFSFFFFPIIDVSQ